MDPILAGVKGPETFFERFKASPEQAARYKPLLLAICRSQGGEQAPSFGVFEAGGELWTVHGTECSVWDFNGQFEPELAAVDELRAMARRGMGMVDGRDVFRGALLALCDRLELEGQFKPAAQNRALAEYRAFMEAEVVGDLDKRLSGALAALGANRIEAAAGCEFWKFMVASPWGEAALYVSPELKLSCALPEGCVFPANALGMGQEFIRRFVSDLEGCMELGCSCFEPAPAAQAPARRPGI